MSPDELAAHRSRIGFEVEVVLSGYWRDDMDPTLKAAVLADWADELEDWTIDQVRWGLREWRRNKSRIRPNPGDILGVLMARRGQVHSARAAAARSPSSAAPQPTAEARAAGLDLMREMFPQVVKRMPGVRGDG